MKDEERRLDGNAAGGLLGEIFALETTLAEGACSNCGSVAPVGAAMVYAHEMGTVVRCATCDNALIRVAHNRGRYFLDLRGLKYLRLKEGA
jgi:NAD-dependent SIR2 family protein deacetylase